MDSGSPAGLVEPVGGVERLADAAGTSFPHLEQARTRTAERIKEAKAALNETEPPDGVSTCVFGSWARQELTDGSDNDWAVLVDHEFDAYEPQVITEVVAAQRVLGDEERKPGAQGVFASPIAIPELVAFIGLDADTNTNLTRRMLLLLESAELHGAVRDAAVAAVLHRYLNEAPAEDRAGDHE